MLSLDSKCRVRPCRLQVYLFHLIHYRPLRPRRQVLFESLNTAGRSFSPRFHTAIRTVAHVAHDLMPRRRTLREEAIPDALHVTLYQKLSRYSQLQPPRYYLHLNNSAGLPFSKVNVSVSSVPVTFNVNVIVLPLIVPE